MRGAITDLNRLPVNLPGRVIMTDDSLRARMLVSHHLEYAAPVFEQGDFSIYSGSYKDVPLALISTGFGVGEVFYYLCELIELGIKEIIYISACMSTTVAHGLGSVILAGGGSQSLLARANAASAFYAIPVVTRTVLPADCKRPEEGCVIDDFTGAFYSQSKVEGVEALSILTVSENSKTGEKMEEHERRSRLHAASRLVFETFAI